MKQELSKQSSNRFDPLRQIVTTLVVVFGLLSASCVASTPVKSFALHVDSEGKYMLEGANVEPSELKNALGSLGNSGSKVELRIHTKAATNHQAVARAVLAAQEARISLVTFVEEPAK